MDRYGNVLVDPKKRGNAVTSVVGHVLPSHLDCGPRGNFSNLGFGSLQTSKFQLHIGKLFGTVFAADFDKALANFMTIQRLKAMTGKCPRIIGQTGREYVRDSQSSGEVSEEEETVDSDTEHWPVPQELRSHLDGIKHEYRVAPLHVFKSDHQSVEPSNVNDVLEDSFASKMEHSFNASIEQIVILQPGVARPLSSYKRKDYQAGPIDLHVPPRSTSYRSVTVSPSPAPNTPEDPWWDWQAEEDPHVQERIWAAIGALEDNARTGHLGFGVRAELQSSPASSTALSSGLYNNSITSLLVGVTLEIHPSTIFPYSALSEPVQPLYTLPLHLFILCLAYIGHALRIALAVAYGILKTCDTVAAANRQT
ncbi:hypothetical protein EDB85DRAFT_1900564 [Lactarius pseudohatsudake]|nr:hypothetical protein EDB85DRAFT_1900564 [Lactarius pseudohatsudake]